MGNGLPDSRKLKAEEVIDCQRNQTDQALKSLGAEGILSREELKEQGSQLGLPFKDLAWDSLGQN